MVGEEEIGINLALRDGRASVTGQTTSSDYPTTPDAFDRTFDADPSVIIIPILGIGDTFVTKLPTG